MTPVPQRPHLSLLLLQARLPDDPMGDHEHRCFVEHSGLLPENIVRHDLRDGPPSLDDLARFDALTVGGSGEYYVSKGNLPQFDEFLGFLRAVVDRGHPTFASCFGYQALVQALGGEVIYDTENPEVGTYELELTEEGRRDSIFGKLPGSFMAQLGHKDRAIRHPDGVPNLARSPRSPFQALRIVDQPIWATQFHPELDRSGLEDRLNRYSDYAEELPGDDKEVVILDSPETSQLLRHFFDRIDTTS